ncbi:MAG: peptidoglycan DD-metalloendopeptidase family protein [Halomonas sp.]|nr:peptidoglycan DD-metalloendopeptidase family protein [Halomonas sp.]MDN6296671.1 peptidoglycan DD-metalloendopeptidase family protein [Halomonas sp.]MDN6314140.1 peptidoglycan DD-metalloendopeptidase family protein [Halomonas sp.]MDN6335177.1 peptidoglycan DD-metalloendopeptidase family protein [Halomonas sp.]
MRKIFVMSVLALAVAGCVNQQNSRPQVRDVSDAQQAVKNTPQYTVKTGDTLYGIAWEHNIDYRKLATLNNIAPPYSIFPGQTIRLRKGAPADDGRQVAQAGAQPAASQGGAVATGLGQDVASNSATGQGGADSQQVDWLLPDEPAETGGTAPASAKNAATDSADQAGQAEDSHSDADKSQVVKAGEPESTADKTPEKASEKAADSTSGDAGSDATDGGAEQKQPATADSSENRADRSYTPAENIAWQWPVKGKLTGRFDEEGSITAGIDIAGEKGQPVKAAGPGIVVYAGSGVRGYGNLVLLKHNDQFLSAYAHNDSLNVSENDVVKAGEVIATMGNSDAESVKLHFEVRKDGEPQDPLTYLPSR